MQNRILIAASLWLAACGSSPEKKAAEPLEPPIAKKTGYRVFVTNENSGDVSVIESATLTVSKTIPVGKRPRGIRVSGDGKKIFIALSGSPAAPPGVDESTLPPPDKSADGVGIIDTEQEKLTRTIKGGSDPELFDLAKDGKVLFVSNEDEAMLSLVDVEQGTLLGSLKVGEEPEGVTTSPDGKFVYVTSEDSGTVSVVDTASRKVIATLKVGRRPRAVAFLPDSSRAYVTNESDGVLSMIDAVKHKVIPPPIRLGEAGKIKPMGIVITRDGSRAYVSTGRGKKVFALDTKSNQVTGSVEVGTRPWGIALSPDEKLLFAADGPSNSVVVVDIEKMAVVKSIPAGQSPWGAVAVPY